MSCKHLIWNCYCKLNQDFCERKLFPRLCDNYCREEDEVEDMKKTFNKGPAADIAVNPDCSKKYPFMITCENGIYKSTAENDYVSMLEMFINKLYTNENFGFFGLNAVQAEEHVDKDMMYLGYNREMVDKALVDTINNFKTNHTSCILRLGTFCNSMLMKPHKDYANYCSTDRKSVV